MKKFVFSSTLSSFPFPFHKTSTSNHIQIRSATNRNFNFLPFAEDFGYSPETNTLIVNNLVFTSRKPQMYPFLVAASRLIKHSRLALPGCNCAHIDDESTSKRLDRRRSEHGRYEIWSFACGFLDLLILGMTDESLGLQRDLMRMSLDGNKARYSRVDLRVMIFRWLHFIMST